MEVQVKGQVNSKCVRFQHSLIEQGMYFIFQIKPGWTRQPWLSELSKNLI